MPTLLSVLCLSCLLLLSTGAVSAEEKIMEQKQTLDARQQAIIPIAAFTADGNLERLKPALVQGLEAGLTINEIKEALVQLYAYVGFPRSLNAIHTFMAVVDERQAEGIKDERGKEASPLPADFDKNAYGAKVRAQLAGLDQDIAGTKWQEFAPAIDTFLKEHLFADIFARDALDHSYRELVTIAALANLSGASGQLVFHYGAARQTGLSEAQLEDFTVVLGKTVGQHVGAAAHKVLAEVLPQKQ